MNITLSAKMQTAKVLGSLAYARGENAAPVLNADCMGLVEGMPVGTGAAEIFASFMEGWGGACLAA